MPNTVKRQRGLGRGLSALMADIEPAEGEATGGPSAIRGDTLVPIEKIHPNPDQPRRI
jgi:ParB family chromosome partitioning protein